MQPAGVGIGKTPPVYLKAGDEITVTITGLGSLVNKVAPVSATNYTTALVSATSYLSMTNSTKTINGSGLTKINGKFLSYEVMGDISKPAIVFIHGIGGSAEYWKPVINALGLAKSHSLHLFDFEGHGLSPTSPLSTLSISSLADDVRGIFEHANISSPATVMAQSLGSLVAMAFTLANPSLVGKLVLFGPPPNPLPDVGVQNYLERAELARTKGMAAVVKAVVDAGTSEYSKTHQPNAIAMVRLSLLSQDPEGYAKGCTALARATMALPLENIKAETVIVTGDEDRVSPPALCELFSQRISQSKPLIVLKQTGHWHNFESLDEVVAALRPCFS
jgi:pimeloyl-ACP methyl ester carboxylesterase